MTDRVARRPHGRKAREVYGADDVHSFAWEPVLAALALGPGDRLLDVGCGGGVFLRRALETGCEAVGLDHSPEMVELARATSGARVVRGPRRGAAVRRRRIHGGLVPRCVLLHGRSVRVLSEFRRVLDPASGRIAIFTTPPEAKGTPAAPYPLATRGHFYTDAELRGAAARRRVRRVARDPNGDRRPAARRPVGSLDGRGRARPGLGRPLRLHDGRAPLRARARPGCRGRRAADDRRRLAVTASVRRGGRASSSAASGRSCLPACSGRAARSFSSRSRCATRGPRARR